MPPPPPGPPASGGGGGGGPLLPLVPLDPLDPLEPELSLDPGALVPLVPPEGADGSVVGVGAGAPGVPGAPLVPLAPLAFAQGVAEGEPAAIPSPRVLPLLPLDVLDVVLDAAFTFHVQPFTSWHRLFVEREVHDGG